MIDTTKHTGLQAVDGFPFAVLSSDGLAERARTIAERCERAHRLLGDILDFRPAFALLVLGPADWGGRSTHPVYGVPNHAAGTLIVAGERNPFWQGFLDLIAAQRPDLLPGLRALYGLPDGTMDLSPFFDLIAVHELAHEFHAQVPYRFPRLWLEELFVNLCLHAYVAEAEPALLPVLETLPPALAALDPARFAHCSLEAFETLYRGVGPVAFGWYQGQFHLAAKRIYDAGGVAALRRLWDTFVLDDARLVMRLTAVQPESAEVLTGWSHDEGLCDAVVA